MSPSHRRRSMRLALALFTVLAASGCSSVLIGGSVSDRLVVHPPYYTGPRPPAGAKALVRLPAAYQQGATHEAIFDPSATPGGAVANLLAGIESYLDSASNISLLVRAEPEAGRRPDVQVGCEYEPDGSCILDRDRVLGRDYPHMRVAAVPASAGWRRWVGSALIDANADAVLVVTLEVGQYWTRQKGVLGAKVVELGTGYTRSFPWLTSLETPVTVLQLTGALVNRDGHVVRAGAEGIMAVRTPLLASAVGAQRLVSDADVRAAAEMRRDDLPGTPLAWEVALSTLVHYLLTPPARR